MRAVTIFTVTIVLAACLLKSTEAVTCTADPTVTGCIDCTDTANAADAECVAEAAANTTTTEAVTTTAATTAASTSATATTAATRTGGNRKVVRLTNFRWRATRRFRINRNRNTSSSTLRTTIRNRRNRSNVRRVNVRNRRGNGNVRVIVG
ncbi:uncharacterized protein LOC110176509 [Drosophila serrata]|uniref:uncharacterized protein LOC110176509 n=1 Tax=Drosophila serrata TaxID=7274 RepID=UPI000A1D0DAB|nr:uncharacterized protein LOC110176509 [Drosophila serrata]KAH8361099.1 hypothetical protein KR200_006574 [Drosophila serrata]